MWLLLALISLLTIIYRRHKVKYEDINKLPGPPTKWFTGNATDFGSTIVESFETTLRMITTYGRIVRLWIGPFQPKLFVTDPDMVEFFLSSNEHINKSPDYATLKLWLGDGLVTSKGESWRKFRKMLTPAFHFKVLEQFPAIFHKNIQTLIEKFKEHNGKSFDVCQHIKYYTIDVICETSLGTTFNCQTNGDNSYIESINTFMDIYFRRFYSFLKRFHLIFKYTKDYTTMNKCIATIQKTTNIVIQNRKQARCRSNGESSTDDFGIKTKKVFMDILLDYPGLSDQEIIWQVDTFMMAGQHTSAAAMSAALYELAKHDEVQKRLLEEIYDVVGTDRNKVIESAELREMHYLDRVSKEILRLYPSVPVFEREISDDVIYNGMKIPANTRIMFIPYSQHRDPELFPEPEKFDPDRFLPDNIQNRHPFAYIPFSAGPRNCIGLRYAFLQLQAFIANVVRQFEIRPSDIPHTPVIGNSAVLTFVNGLPVKLVCRD